MKSQGTQRPPSKSTEALRKGDDAREVRINQGHTSHPLLEKSVLAGALDAPTSTKVPEGRLGRAQLEEGGKVRIVIAEGQKLKKIQCRPRRPILDLSAKGGIKKRTMWKS